jgi:ATP-binding protein involved in chromosome partitioning
MKVLLTNFGRKNVRSIFGFFEKKEVKLPEETKSTPQGIKTDIKKQVSHGVKTFDLPNIKYLIAVASGKGGVGKSTVATNLALALSQGYNQTVALVDADIYGPSIHRMMNLTGKPRTNDAGKMIPKSNYGIKTMSMGFLVPEDSPTIWRGPMVMGMVEQLIRDVDWGDIDVLVIDLPPGTGDVQLTLCQRVPLTGAVIVSTPQDIALIDATRGTNMFRKVNVPILGIIENMSFYQCRNCGHVEHLFSHGGAKSTAERMEIPFLGEIPINIEIRENSDSGKPIALERNTISEPFYQIAGKLMESLENTKKSTKENIPNIVIE